MNEAAQLFCAAAPHESLNFWPWRDVPRARGGLHPVAFKGWPERDRNQGLGIAVGAGF